MYVTELETIEYAFAGHWVQESQIIPKFPVTPIFKRSAVELLFAESRGVEIT